MLRSFNGDPGGGIDCDAYLPVGKRRVSMQATQPPKRGEPPLLLAAGRHAEVGRVVGPQLVQAGDGSRGFHGSLEASHQPTAPSICSSISRFSSSAYSIGSSRAIGSTNPRTMVAAASSSVIPRLIR